MRKLNLILVLVVVCTFSFVFPAFSQVFAGTIKVSYKSMDGQYEDIKVDHIGNGSMTIPTIDSYTFSGSSAGPCQFLFWTNDGTVLSEKDGTDINSITVKGVPGHNVVAVAWYSCPKPCLDPPCLPCEENCSFGVSAMDASNGVFITSETPLLAGTVPGELAVDCQGVPCSVPVKHEDNCLENVTAADAIVVTDVIEGTEKTLEFSRWGWPNPSGQKMLEVSQDQCDHGGSGLAFYRQYRDWSRSYNGPGSDIPNDVNDMEHKGFVVVGTTDSWGEGKEDVWVKALDVSGHIRWEGTYGGNMTENGMAIERTNDGGWIIVGYTKSFGSGLEDIWVLKMDGDGEIQWQAAYGSEAHERGLSIKQTSDGGYIVAGSTEMVFDEQDKYKSRANIVLLKLFSTGLIEWQKALLRPNLSSATVESVHQTVDGGYILGWSVGSGPGYYTSGLTLAKFSSLGDCKWQRKFYARSDPNDAHLSGAGGGAGAFLGSVELTKEGGYVVSGTNRQNKENSQLWVAKFGQAGNEIWQKSYVQKHLSSPGIICRTNDGGFILVSSLVNKIPDWHKSIWVLKLGENGEITWQKKYETEKWVYPTSVRQSTDGGYVIVAYEREEEEEIPNEEDAEPKYILNERVLKLNTAGEVTYGCGFSLTDAVVKVETGYEAVPSDLIIEVKTEVTEYTRKLTSVTKVTSSAEISRDCPDFSAEQ